MATKIYESDYIYLMDGTEVFITPLKLFYLREFMTVFDAVHQVSEDKDTLSILSACATICMKQYYPTIRTIEDLEDSIDIKTIYKILDIAAGIKMANRDGEEDEEQEDAKSVTEKAKAEGGSWDKLDLAELESEVFLLGIWKDYEELERSLSMPELTAILNIKREKDYQDKKFLAAMQGVDLDKQSGKQNAWEEKKAKFFSGGLTSDGNDVLALKGANAARAGFGIGMGLGYQKID
jgi:hypothetical protein